MTQDNAAKPTADPQAVGSTSVPASGSDPDSRKRELKARLAAAETSGDHDAVKAARADLDRVNEELGVVERGRAAASRREAAKGDPEAQTRAPAQRSSTPATKTTTGGAKAPTSGGAKPSADK